MPWPIIDRPDLRTAAISELKRRPSRAVVLRGPSGIGKTTVARAVADEWAADGAAVLSIVGLEELSGAPLAAFVPLMSSLDVDVSGVAGVTAHQVIAAVGVMAPDALLVVDDAPLLDEATAAVLYHLIRAYALPTLMTVRSGHPTQGVLERLTHEDLATIFEVSGLGRPEVETLLRARLGASLRPDDVSRLEHQTAGNPLHLRELVDLAERWGLTKAVPAGIELEPVELPPGLDASIADRVSGLDHDHTHVLQLVALGAGAPVEVILPAGRERSLADNLVRDGFLIRRPDGTVRVAHPAYREAAIASLEPGQRDDILYDVADRLEAHGDSERRFAAVQLRCETARGASRADLEWAVRRAYAMGEHLVALDLSQRARAADSDTPLAFGAAVDSASSASTLGQFDEAESDFAEAESVAGGSADLALLASRWGAHLAYRRFDVEGALALAARLGPQLSESDTAVLGPDVRTWRVLMGGAIADSRDPALDATSATSPEVAIRGAIAAVMLDSMGGRPADEAAALLIRVEQDHGVLDPFAADIVHLQRYFMLLSIGDGEAAEATCVQRRVDCTADAVGMWSLTLGIHRQYAGRLESAHGLAELAVEQLRWRDPLGLLGFAMALRALVVAQLGEHDRARSLLGELTPALESDPKAAILAAEARAHLAFAEGDPDGAAQIMVDAATGALGSGFDLVAAIGLGLGLRFDRAATVAPLLHTIRGGVDPAMRLYAALDDAAAGLIQADPARVLVAAKALAGAGMVAAAIDAICCAERMVVGSGGGELRRKLERTRVQLSAHCEARPYQARIVDDSLSGREWDVAERVRKRLTNREIASDLGISVRTVENHLAKAYRKLGVSSRSELRTVLEDADKA